MCSTSYTHWNEGKKERGCLHIYERVDYYYKTTRSEKRKWFYVSLQNTSHTFNMQEREKRKVLIPRQCDQSFRYEWATGGGVGFAVLVGPVKGQNNTTESDEAAGWLLKLHILL